MYPQLHQGQTAIITGGAQGIGLGIARRLAAQGCKIIIWDLMPEAFDAGKEEFEPLALEKVDVSNLENVRRAFDAALRQTKTVEILVTCAGINGPNHPLWEYPLEALHKVINIDLLGVLYCCMAVAGHMKATGYGRILNVASYAGKEGNAGNAPYAAAKAGVIGMTKALSKELAGPDTNIMVNSLAPAVVETGLLKELSPEFVAMVTSKIPLGRMVQVEDVAAMAAWICSRECSMTTGFCFDLSGGRSPY